VTLSGNDNHALATLAGGVIDADATIIANTDGDNCSGAITGINSVADDATCGSIPSTLTGLDPSRADNGGPTETHALLAGSNAIEGAGFCSTPTDQRGAPRVGACDVGAFEYLGCPVLTLSDTTITGAASYEECAIEVGPNLTVLGPDGDLILRFGRSASFGDAFSVQTGARLVVERDPSLSLVLPELVEADRMRRRRAGPR